MIYLASPYSHKEEWMRELRYPKDDVKTFFSRERRRVTRAAAELVRRGHVVFSPITHSHPLDTVGGMQEHGWSFWQSQDIPFMEACDELHVLMLPGWKESEGVSAEVDWWHQNKQTRAHYWKPEELVPDLGEDR